MRRVTVPGSPLVRPIATAQLLSVAGTQITALALPTLAVLELDAGPLAASLLFALEFGLQGLTAPLVGVVVDAVRSRKRLLILTDIVHGLVVCTVPLAFGLDRLSVGLLFSVAALSGVLSGVTSVGVQAIIPQLVDTDRLVSANATLTGARSVGQIAGPAIAGWLVQVVGAAHAVAVDAVSYALSALILTRVRLNTDRLAGGTRSGMIDSLRDGMVALRGRPLLIRIAAAGAALNLGGSALGGLFALYAYRRLHLSPFALGVTFAAYSAAAIVGVLTASRVIARLGLARVVPFFAPAAAGALILIPGAAIAPPLPVLLVYEAVFGYCATVWMIGSIGLQQSLVPAAQLGRVLALSRTLTVLAIPVGALGGGALATFWGLLPTLVTFAAVALVGTAAVVTAPGAFADDRSSAKTDEKVHTGGGDDECT